MWRRYLHFLSLTIQFIVTMLYPVYQGQKMYINFFTEIVGL